MKLRPSPADKKALNALKKYYSEKTGTKAIWRAVRQVMVQDKELALQRQTIIELRELSRDLASSLIGYQDAVKRMDKAVAQARKL